MQEIKISVVIPTCDRPRYLKETLDSVISQSLSPHEIIIIDNGHTPVQKNKIPKDYNIRLIRALPRFGVAQARNLGIILSEGTHISFLDDDDTWDNFYLENVSNEFFNTDADIVFGKLRSLSTSTPLKGKQSHFQSRSDLIKKILRKNPGAVGSNTNFRRSAVVETSGYDPYITTGQDKAIVLDLLINKCIPARSENAWVNFREDTDGVRQMELKKWIKGKRRFLQKYWKYMDISDRTYNIFQIARLWFRYLLKAKA